ncbi:MAG: DeoR/GlpR family DNA-binding transcription regulator [Streptococcaceae bacterium]|jgi:DeoR/GlpR family transcriptional regulator of sugar metabolism|nr:DeoR/GlpR family DNA-binding transcription regulator [Streptococcaceae bacterium]MCH4178152.1 DeoR/GlpR family DNA-binding transcription regulator [Streptococcaceae bacterium]
MKNSKKNVNTRQARIIELLKITDEMQTKELAEYFKISLPTIRRDLKSLENMGKIKKTHGKARLINDIAIETKQNEQLEHLKNQLAKAATSFVKDDDTVFINSSSAALEAVQNLIDRRVTIISNNVLVTEIEHNPNSTVILTGGEVLYPKEALVGQVALNFIETVRANVSILGVYGLTIAQGLTTPVIHESKINHAMIKQTTGKVIIIADYRKIGNIANFQSATIDQIDVLITDTFADSQIIKQIKELGIQVIQVEIF